MLGKRFNRLSMLAILLSGGWTRAFAYVEGISDGSVNYSYGMEALAEMTTEVVVAMGYVASLVLTGSCIFAYYNVAILTYKIQHGENGVIKAILQLFMAVVFIVICIYFLPALFGYDPHKGKF